MADMTQIIEMGRQMNASDIHISAGLPLMIRVDGTLMEAPIQLPQEETSQLILSMLNGKQLELLKEGHDLDFPISLASGERQRVNVFRQQEKLATTIRLLNNHIPSLQELNLPPVLRSLAEEPRGLILVTGPTGSGKSTTLAAMIDYINTNRAEHIITVEDPIEYVYEQKNCLIHQRETGRDVTSFAAALRSALREDPDIILVGEMRDYETISAALTAAETGHLVLSTLHTTGAAQTIDRIIDACPAASQNQIRTQLSGVLKGVITQCLIPKIGGGRIAATEVLLGTDAAMNLVRENKCHQLGSVMQSGRALGMHSLNSDLARLVESNIIEKELAYQYSNDRKDMDQFLV
ncbi:MAG: type IV pilus twitching motility protein PilT [Lachnospiraceae bacterium]|nr:type IV pilus twitching motility protein PilT [Lachnospiraceae bacterium]